MSVIKRIVQGAAVAAALPVGATAESYGKYEAPSYVVERRLGDVEIRSYAPHIVAEVTVRGDRRDALSTGFRILAGYIFGGNTTRQSVDMTSPVAQSQKIDMTSPVTQEGVDGLWTVSFMMPSKWTLESLPDPTNEAIRLRQTDDVRQAVVIFGGRATAAAIEAAEQTLTQTLSEAGLAGSGPMIYNFYDDPMTLPWNRRNEVAVALATGT